MASASADSPAPAREESPAPETLDKKDILYNKCAQAPDGTVFYQRDFVNMHVAENTTALMRLLQELVDSHLMKTMMWENQPCWKLRSRDEAAKLRAINADERHIYHLIDEVQNAGIWIRALRQRTGLTQMVLTKCLKSLETKALIQCVMNVKNPSRKMYLLKHLEPSAEIVGGPWQTDGDYDIGLIEVISNVVVRYVEHETWIRVPVGMNNTREAAVAKKKAQVQATRDIEDAPAVQPFRPPLNRNRTTLLPRSNVNLPTCTSILQHVLDIGIIKGKVIRESDMEQLLEMMVLDGRLEKITPSTYRTVRDAKDADDDTEGSWNGFVDAPCGTCPVFELCGDEGDITARTCVYFAEWLGTE
ncbi:DNA-directed RNA polymeras-like protein III subunit Rpc34 [Zopfia rhizophila CBS 207.26]|uniref:DNA-directed RNA polymerase III subunit RPC6 n=1 Tax=Zopfia rhizophila CBS 207.26 TaxID=1314779 RepID=A0A6A6E434_9PEZI|nr:DNA-directed RNA polymeras-like protein III subunit Rpc34 [Zopfia rhizophila CBS 207.26]